MNKLRFTIAAHRGAWSGSAEANVPAVEKNSLAAFRIATENHFGIETDFRDICGRLYISHNPPDLDAPRAIDLVELLKPGQTVLVNVKADGLAPALKQLADLSKFGECRLFAFDMSVPDTLGYMTARFPFLERVSEYEPVDVVRPLSGCVFPKRSGIWLDGFRSVWYDEPFLRRALKDFGRVAVVSPELHGRDPYRLWRMLDAVLSDPGSDVPEKAELILCTDRPFEARTRFGAYETTFSGKEEHAEGECESPSAQLPTK